MRNEELGIGMKPGAYEELMAQRRRREAAFERTIREQRAYDYIERVTRRVNTGIKRMLLGSMVFFLWAAALALLVGARQ